MRVLGFDLGCFLNELSRIMAGDAPAHFNSLRLLGLSMTHPAIYPLKLMDVASGQFCAETPGAGLWMARQAFTVVRPFSVSVARWEHFLGSMARCTVAGFGRYDLLRCSHGKGNKSDKEHKSDEEHDR